MGSGKKRNAALENSCLPTKRTAQIHDKACSSLSKRRTIFQLCAWVFQYTATLRLICMEQTIVL